MCPCEYKSWSFSSAALCSTLLAFLLVLLTMSPLAVDAAVLDEAAGRAFLKFDSIVFAGFMLAAIHTGSPAA